MTTSVPVTQGIENLFGTRDENIRHLETELGVRTRLNTDALSIEGEPDAVARAERIFLVFFAFVRVGAGINARDAYRIDAPGGGSGRAPRVFTGFTAGEDRPVSAASL